MKRLVSILIALTIVMSVSVTAFADIFIGSPSMKRARIRSFVPGSPDCQAEVYLTPYADRNTLDAERVADLEQAYDEIKAAASVVDLNAGLAVLAERLGVPVANLAVADLFDISFRNCGHEEHQQHGEFTITIEPETMKNFAGLIHFWNEDWEIVETTAADGTVTFKITSFSPFAVVVYRDETAPDTGDTTNISFWGMMMAASATAMVVCYKKSKKYN